VLHVKQKDALVQEIRVNEICQVNLMGNIQISTQAVQDLCQEGIPVCYFSMGGWFLWHHDRDVHEERVSTPAPVCHGGAAVVLQAAGAGTGSGQDS
jgi:hypothetical protein